MSELGDLLELLHGAGTGDRTVCATVTSWQHHERTRDAFTAQIEEGNAAVFLAVGAGDEPAPAESTTTTRLWIAPPDRVREESGDHVAVRRGQLWWTYSPDEGALTNADDEDAVDQIAARAPFAVFMPERLAPEWEMDVLFDEGGGRRGDGAWVQMALRSADGHWSAAIRQAADGDAVEQMIFISDADPTPWVPEQHGGREMQVRRPASEWASASVRLTLEGTAIEVTSTDVDADRLAEIAATLVRAPDAPPPFA